MKQVKRFDSNERGATLVEFAIAVTVFLTAMFGVIEFGRALWAHNALTDAARRGARYATLHTPADTDAIKNVVVYGDPAGGTQPIVPNLTTDERYRQLFKHRGEQRDGLCRHYQLPIPVCHSLDWREHHDAGLQHYVDR